MSQIQADLNQIVDEAGNPLRDLVDRSVFLTGGTGFVGTWLTKSWVHAAHAFKGSGRLVILSRDPSSFLRSHGPLPQNVEFAEGDIRTFRLSGHESFDLVVHAATPARASVNSSSPKEMLSIIVDGQRNLIDQVSKGGRPRCLFTSSGAVYGPQPVDTEQVDETQLTGPDPLNPLTAYHEGKRIAELLLSLAGSENVLDPVIARLFAFVGPYLPLDEHFAVGNFIRDGLAGGPIIVKGDGTTVRSYQYPTDMAVWLWTIAERGARCRAYNVGSEVAYTMRQIAHAVALSTNIDKVEVLGVPKDSQPIDRYVPSTKRANEELGLTNNVSFPEALERTVSWHKEVLPR